jgi:outer membrane receptor for ferrienterochelin and colicins
MEGPYTMVLIDGMPIVSSLGAVYGLSGIPNALIERVEIVRGPASSLYGSEAVGGLINVITKSPDGSPKVSADVMTTSWLEHNIDLGLVAKAGKRMSMLLGINYFNFSQKTDHNKDQFTDVTLQDRLSIYQKWILHRQSKKAFAVAARYMYEDRWGGDLRWNKQFRGGDSIYGESIFTNRWEISGLYQLPGRENLQLQFSYNSHNQNSAYATTSYIARQNIAFAQLTWDKKTGRHDLLSGIALRYTYYDDNTPGTGTPLINAPQKTWLPGIFVQDEIRMAANKSLLLGLRYDHNNYHGNIFTPRLAFKWTLRPGSLLRLNAGTGFRVVNLFTEDHAALTGARIVEIKNELRPERSYNVNINLAKKIRLPGNTRLNLELTAFYTYFNNRIVGDYDRDPNKIIYDNLEGYAENKGVSLNADVTFKNGIRTSLGATIMENTLTTQGNTVQQILSENGTGTWLIGYTIKKLHTSIDYTGNIYSPMRLPLLGDLDPRSPRSPWWSIQNIQATFTGLRNIEVYGGVKNLLNWTPNRGNPFIIARAFDPFDKQVQFDANGQPMATPGNPNALTFDPTYVYAPNQGIRWFIGIRTNLKPGRK